MSNSIPNSPRTPDHGSAAVQRRELGNLHHRCGMRPSSLRRSAPFFKAALFWLRPGRILVAGLFYATLCLSFLLTSCTKGLYKTTRVPARGVFLTPGLAEREPQVVDRSARSLPSLDEEVWIIGRARTRSPTGDEEAPGGGSIPCRRTRR